MSDNVLQRSVTTAVEASPTPSAASPGRDHAGQLASVAHAGRQ